MNRHSRRTAASHKKKMVDINAAEALQLAIRHHKADELQQAEAIYLRLLEAIPDQPDALHFLGVLRHQQRRTEEGIALVRRALEEAPEYVDAWNNLGNLYKESERLAEAEEAYRRALALNAEHGGAWNNLGILLRVHGRAEEAVEAFRHVLRLSPSYAEAYFNLGNALRVCGQVHEVLAAYRHAVALNPRHARAHYLLGYTLYLVGEHEEAAGVFRAWSEVEPGNPIPRHMLAACSGEDVPARASDDYIRSTFDTFAESFDEMLLQRLDYHAPDLLATALGGVLDAPAGALEVLDAGCGTGLCGPLLKPWARRLVGVDLSGGMLEKARARGVYDYLEQAELAAFLGARAGTYDVIASADTLCYFGELGAVTRAARGALRPAGWFGFTVERADGEVAGGYRINPHGRYSHAADYVRAALLDAGFEAPQLTPAVLRLEIGEPVQGWVVLARVPPAV
ncbi:putative TPR repeat methyltransferase [Plasticicumulans lactativorans]|uniref:Putative TPR repeat methyltransferase n=1 Tax=Plasticicumulans lactativorans TaxID=1133106 RepID=A0A4R2L633_9GAMM|nr:tetratricopeptide repeat protein [Plasticicumulans lactativorans]TCO78098.1 putative TPR repeat methyltransferase [Plasticicumulans lactativorans]